jgi:hypothetical protein
MFVTRATYLCIQALPFDPLSSPAVDGAAAAASVQATVRVCSAAIVFVSGSGCLSVCLPSIVLSTASIGLFCSVVMSVLQCGCSR